MQPWAAAVTDALEAITTPEVIDMLLARGLVEVLPLTHIRGRTLVDTWVVLDEAQQYERPVLVTALTRLGSGSKVVLTHDVAQRDNLRVGRYDGVVVGGRGAEGRPALRPHHADSQSSAARSLRSPRRCSKLQ